MRPLIVGLLLAGAAAYPADIFSFGVKGGAPLNGAFNGAKTGSVRYFPHNDPFTVGPELDFNLPFGFGIEVDALFRPLEFRSSWTTSAGSPVISRTTASSWSFPVLLKKRFGEGRVKPYLSAGPTFQGLANIEERVDTFTGPIPQSQATGSPESLRDKFTTGFTAAGGLQLGLGIVRISPEIRYTRWGWENFRSVDSLLKSSPDQWDLLLGITF